MTDQTFPSSRSRLAALIGEARRRGRHRRFALAATALIALLVAGGIWAGLALSGGGGGTAAVHAPPGFHVVQAQGPVAHRILETWISAQPFTVDLATGKGRAVRTTREIWYDSHGDVTRFVDRADGRTQHDFALACAPVTARACFPGFSFQNYWSLDKSRYTRAPGIGTFQGRPVIWIAPRQPGGFAASPGDGERIGLDPRTHEPVADRTYSNGKVISQAQVLERKHDIAADKYAFVVPNPTPPLRQDPSPEVRATGTDPFALRARRALGQRPLWLGERFHGNRLQAVTIGSTFDPPSGIRPDAAPFVEYDYGNVRITEFDARALYGPGQGFLPGRVTLLEAQTSTSPNSSPIEDVQLARDGVLVLAFKDDAGNYVLDRAGALRLARALRPVPLT